MDPLVTASFGGFRVSLIADSVNPTGVRITTLSLRYPRFIHSEFMTHRVFSRNAASSRAIPVEKMIEQVRNDPAEPIYWGMNKPGMQATEEWDFDGENGSFPLQVWRAAADRAAEFAGRLHIAGLHKQVVNRLLEPWQWMHTVVTATEWDNFFRLRCHPDAQPEFQQLATMIREVMENHNPQRIYPGSWHLPYVSVAERADIPLKEVLLLSVARCARVSYLKHDGTPAAIEEDLKLAKRLLGPQHMSPFEHQAKSTPDAVRWSNNFRPGWTQFRELVDHGYLDS